MNDSGKQLLTAGPAPAVAKSALIMIHGRGSTAGDILKLAGDLNVADFALYAPQAAGHSWYPYSFLAPDEKNQPALNSALEVIDETVQQVIANGTAVHRIFFLGFSQGACLTLEYIARHAQPFGGAVAFTGGLIGEVINPGNYSGDFIGMPLLVTTGNPDPHVPLARVEQSVKILKSMDAAVTLKVYNGRPHTIGREEIKLANSSIFN